MLLLLVGLAGVCLAVRYYGLPPAGGPPAACVKLG